MSIVPALGSHRTSSSALGARLTSRRTSKPLRRSVGTSSLPTSPEAPVTAIFPRSAIADKPEPLQRRRNLVFHVAAEANSRYGPALCESFSSPLKHSRPLQTPRTWGPWPK